MANWLWSSRNPSKTAKLIRFDGGIERIKINMAVKVAELMLDNPHHFVCNLSSLKAGHRILALPAEEELERGNTYVLLPMHKLRSVLSESDMGSIYHYKNKSKLIFSPSKIVPLSPDGVGAEKKSSLPKLVVANEEEIERMRIRISGQRCWKPSLQTIQETRSLKL